MLISVTDFRDATGDTASSDAEITRALTRVQNRIEGYLDRMLESQEHVDKHLFVGPEPVVLLQWPVTALTSIDKDGDDIDVSSVLLDWKTGLLHHKNKLTWGEDVEITYTAGYESCPEDIKMILIDLAQSHLAGTLEVMGPASTRALKRDTVYGVSSVEYDTNLVDTKGIEFYPELGPYTRMLDKYKRPYEVPSF